MRIRFDNFSHLDLSEEWTCRWTIETNRRSPTRVHSPMRRDRIGRNLCCLSCSWTLFGIRVRGRVLSKRRGAEENRVTVLRYGITGKGSLICGRKKRTKGNKGDLIYSLFSLYPVASFQLVDNLGIFSFECLEWIHSKKCEIKKSKWDRRSGVIRSTRRWWKEATRKWSSIHNQLSDALTFILNYIFVHSVDGTIDLKGRTRGVPRTTLTNSSPISR